MHCARCGKEAREGDRFCRECGAEIRPPDAGAEPRPALRERLARVVGTTRRERLLAAGTAIAIAIAIAAFFALDTPSEESEEDLYTATADTFCIESKRAIANAGSRALSAVGQGVEDYAGDLLREIAGWRSEMLALTPPADRQDEADELDGALLEVLVGAAELARAARSGSDPAAATAATRIDDASLRVEQAIDELELERCGELQLTSPVRAG